MLIWHRALCNTYLQLTTRGTSITFASGDGGVASTPGVECSENLFSFNHTEICTYSPKRESHSRQRSPPVPSALVLHILVTRLPIVHLA